MPDGSLKQFRCGHPKTPENTRRGKVCALCERIDNICNQHRRDQARINAGKPLGTLGQRIAKGNV